MWAKSFRVTESHPANLPDGPGMFEKPVTTVGQTPCGPVEQLVTLLSVHDLYGTAVKNILRGVPLPGQRPFTATVSKACTGWVGCGRGDGRG